MKLSGGLFVIVLLNLAAGMAQETQPTESVVRKPPVGPPVGLGAFYWDRVVPRVGRPERLCALVENTTAAGAAAVTVRLATPPQVHLAGNAETELTLNAGEVRLLSWTVQADQPTTADFTLTVAFKDGEPVRAALPCRFAPAVKATTRPDYVPPPVPAKTDHVVGGIYFPGWKQGTHYGWQRIVPFPERKPALGWYDENDPEVTDWEIKWAVEHGLSFFLYCWYRDRANEGKPVTVEQVYLGHAIHDGFFHARYRDRFKFTIMWENANCGGVASMDDLMNNLLPFWIKEYFSHPSYLKLDNKPLLFIYDWGRTVRDLGGSAEKVRAAFDGMREACRRAGLGGLLIYVENRGANEGALRQAHAFGFDGVFPYCRANRLTGTYKLNKPDLATCLPTVSMGWNSAPWGNGWERGWRLPGGGRLTPAEFKAACATVKQIADGLPADRIDRRIVLIDNWNEWGEGHYVLPHRQHGFGYLDAVREVFAPDSPAHEDITPEDVGLGPYDSRFRAALEKDKFGAADAIIRQLAR